MRPKEWTAEAGNGELHVLVAGRFMVKVTAATTDLPTLENSARLIPMQKLAALKQRRRPEAGALLGWAKKKRA